jgi:D-glycero-alpha-D-manno-heptose-7-phosphate kinase
MRTIRARAPLRLGIAGGGTDVAPYCDQYGGYVLNATISRYAYATIRPLNRAALSFQAMDLKKNVTFSLGDAMPLNGSLDLHKVVYRHFINEYNQGEPLALDVSTFCDAPAGSGLGSSSTLVVAMIQAFVSFFNAPLDDYAMAHLAYTLEREQCGLQGGKQDQYSATFGGFNFMEFYAEGRTIVNPLRIKPSIVSELEASLVLFYTGVSRASATIIADQSRNVAQGLGDSIDAMHGIKEEALLMKTALLKGDFAGFAASMRVGWARKKASSASVSNEHIDAIYDAAMKQGALAGKVSGAGGGGFMLFFVPPEKRMSVIDALSSFDGKVSSCHFTDDGSQAWYVKEHEHEQIYS